MTNKDETLGRNVDYSKVAQAIADKKEGLLRNPANWPEYIERAKVSFDNVPNMVDGFDNIIAQMAHGLSSQIQFPVSTAFVHGLGVLSAAMTRTFTVKMFGPGDEPKACSAYFVTAQPPSSGKSSVHTAFDEPVQQAYETVNKKRHKQRLKIQAKLRGIKQELKDSDNEKEIAALYIQQDELQEQFDALGPIVYSTDDPTPESVDGYSSKQGGFWTVTSSEAQSLESLMGGQYSMSGKSSNANIILKSWDNERMSTARNSRTGNQGLVKGSIAVIAQDVLIELVINSASRGIGIAERFLMYSEPDMLGVRDYSNATQLDPQVKAQYRNLISNVVQEDSVLLMVNEDCAETIKNFLAKIEPHLKADATFGSSVMRGFYGKAYKHIVKIACILHTAKEWAPGGHRKQDIEVQTIREAILLFRKFGYVYQAEANDKGVAGKNTERELVMEFIRKFCETKKKTFIKNEELRVGVKSYSIFKGKSKLGNYIRESVLSEIQEDGGVYLVKNGFHVNPSFLN